MDSTPTDSDDFSDDPGALQELLRRLLELFEDVVHGRDSAMQVIQDVPNWRDRYQEQFRASFPCSVDLRVLSLAIGDAKVTYEICKFIP